MKPWFLLFVFFPLYSQAYDLYIDPYEFIIEESRQERRCSYLIIEDRLKLIHQRLLMMEMYVYDESPYELYREYVRLKKEYALVRKTLIQLKER